MVFTDGSLKTKLETFNILKKSSKVSFKNTPIEIHSAPSCAILIAVYPKFFMKSHY